MNDQPAARSAGPATPSWWSRLARLLSVLLVLLVLVQATVAFAILISHRRGEAPPGPELTEAALAAGGLERVEFYAQDGVKLVGDLLGDPSRSPVVVFGHGYRDRRRGGDPLALELLARGYAVLLFDFRGSGASGGAFSGAGAVEGRDVAAALRWLERARGVPAARTAYVGFSMGAAAGLMAAHSLGRLAAVVLIAPYARLEDTCEARARHFLGLPLRPLFSPAMAIFDKVLGVDCRRVNPVEHAAEIAPAPLLLIGAAGDWRVPPSVLEAILAAAREPKELIVLNCASHVRLSYLGADVLQPVLEHLARFLPP